MTVEASVRQFIQQNFNVADASALAADASLISEGIVDSTGMLEMIGFLEKQFGIRIGDEETIPENLDTIARIAAFVGRKTRAA